MKSSLVLLLLAAAASVTHGYRVRTDGCPEPYDRLDETRCILTDPFVNRKYDDALAFCKTHGGNLLHFDTCADQILVYDYLHAEVGLAGKSYWLGATDAAKEGEWVWEHNKNAVPMSNPFWHVGQPNPSTANNCSFIHSSYSHRWVAAPCTNSYTTICLRDG